MKHIILIGPSYSGKSEFAKKIALLGYKYYSIGDICRKANYPIDTCLGIDEIVDLVVKNIDFSHPCIIDNLFKTANTVLVIDKLEDIGAIRKQDLLIVEIDESMRNHINFSSRGRIDDEMIQCKREVWIREHKLICDKIKQIGLNHIVVYSVDGGFLLRL